MIVTSFRKRYLLVSQNFPCFFLNFAYACSNSVFFCFLFFGYTVILFVNGHGKTQHQKKIRRNIASFHKSHPDFLPLKSCIFANFSFYFQIVFCEKRALLCFSFQNRVKKEWKDFILFLKDKYINVTIHLFGLARMIWKSLRVSF